MAGLPLPALWLSVAAPSNPSLSPPCRLLFWAVGSGLVATAGLLMSVLQAQSGSSSAAAAGILQRALEAAGGHAAAGALSRLDGLAQLHLSMQAASAAALQRAAEVRALLGSTPACVACACRLALHPQPEFPADPCPRLPPSTAGLR